MQAEWDILPGDHLTREERHALYGGATLGGVQPSRSTPNVFLYSDPSIGGVIYPYDGWDSGHDVFLYTGEGRMGDQTMAGGNRAILEHAAKARALRLFVADGIVSGTQQKQQLYLGEFRVDPEDPFYVEPALDDAGEERSVFVFRLLPVGTVLERPQDESATGGAPTSAEAHRVPPELHQTPIYETAGSEPSTAERRESDLVKRFESRLEEIGHTPKRWRLRPPGELRTMVTDTYDETDKVLYEAKGTTTRGAVREAIGQLLDYRRHTPEAELSLALLLPARPSDDLLNLIHSVDMTCTFEEYGGGFTSL